MLVSDGDAVADTLWLDETLPERVADAVMLPVTLGAPAVDPLILWVLDSDGEEDSEGDWDRVALLDAVAEGVPEAVGVRLPEPDAETVPLAVPVSVALEEDKTAGADGDDVELTLGVAEVEGLRDWERVADALAVPVADGDREKVGETEELGVKVSEGDPDSLAELDTEGVHVWVDIPDEVRDPDGDLLCDCVSLGLAVAL